MSTPNVWWSPIEFLLWQTDGGVVRNCTGYQLANLPDDAVRLIPADVALGLLDDVLEDLESAIPYAGEYFDEKWSMSANLADFRRRRALLGVSAREATDTTPATGHMIAPGVPCAGCQICLIPDCPCAIGEACAEHDQAEAAVIPKDQPTGRQFRWWFYDDLQGEHWSNWHNETGPCPACTPDEGEHAEPGEWYDEWKILASGNSRLDPSDTDQISVTEWRGPQK